MATVGERLLAGEWIRSSACWSGLLCRLLLDGGSDEAAHVLRTVPHQIEREAFRYGLLAVGAVHLLLRGQVGKLDGFVVRPEPVRVPRAPVRAG